MTPFAVTWDYRCPFARNAHEHVIDGLAAGAPWDVTFVPFSLGQVHVADGEPPIWERPDHDSGLVALMAGVHARDAAPEVFLDVHRDLFSIRHDHGRDLRDPDVVAKVLADHGVDPEAAFEAIADGSLLATVRAEHERAASEHSVWGVPTFIVGDRAAFARIMDRPAGDGAHARATIDRIITLVSDVPGLNELKHTSIAN